MLDDAGEVAGPLPRTWVSAVRTGSANPVVVFLALAGFFMKTGTHFSRIWYGGWAIGGFAGLIIMRFMVSRMIIRWSRNGRMERRAVIVGGGQEAERLIRGIGVYGTPLESEVGMIADFHRNVRERLEADVERTSLELIHLHSRRFASA